ncbi:hypothetical protein ACLB2K_040975 [Fragaria x ananassa]
MAASASKQSIFLANSVAYGAGNRNSSVRVNQLVPTLHREVFLRRNHLQFQNHQRFQLQNLHLHLSHHHLGLPNVSTKFGDVFALNGSAPERISGRLAMVGFVSALAVELLKGQDVFSQISDGGISVFLGTSNLLSVASVIPLLQGVSVESKSL